MLFGGGRRTRGCAAASTRCSRLLTRGRCGRLLLGRLRRILGVPTRHHGEHENREDHARMARWRKTNGHVSIVSLMPAIDPARPLSPYEASFPGGKPVLAQNCGSLAAFARPEAISTRAAKVV
jgi:hypothetical protein